ncbi:MAG: TonB-dependent receptor [Bacteroidota bacterium]
MKPFATAIVILLAAFPSILLAQGSIRGSVSDSTTHDMLVGANVHLTGTAFGGITNLEGKYSVTNIPAGSYHVKVSYVGYKSRERDLTIRDGETLTFDAALSADIIEGSEVVVTGQVRGQVAAINQQLNSSTIVNVISEEKIQELPDANAAEAIGRLPGVSIIRSGGEASKVILRGMDDRFTSFTIDGVRIPPTDPDSRGVDLSTISQGSLAGVELFNALTPDKDADAIAGSINLVTRKAPSERTIRFDAKGAYSALDKYAGQYVFNGKYGERFFSDLLGVQVTGNLERRNRSNEAYSTSIENQNALNGIGYLYSDLTVAYTNEIRKRGGLSLLLDFNTPDNGSIRINNIYNRTDRNYTVYNRDYPVGDYVSYTARDREQNINTFSSAIRGENNLIGLDLVWGASFAQSKAETPYDYRMSFIEPSINDSAGMRPVPRSAQMGDPQALIPYAYNNFQKAFIDTGAFDNESNLDKDRTLFLDVAKKYAWGDLFSGEVKAGGKYRYKNRFKESSEMIAPYYLGYYQDYTLNGDGTITRKNFAGTQFANLMLTGRNVLFTNFLDSPPENRNIYDKYALNPLINRDAMRLWYELNKNGMSPAGQREYYYNPEVGADYYDIIERVQAAYLMNTLNIGPLVTFIAGVRVEKETNDYKAKYVSIPLGGFPTTGQLLDTLSSYSETMWLPNLHLTVRPTDFLTVRLAAYRAIARPDFNTRLVKNVARVTNPRDLLVIGNPNLKNAKAWNYEINTSFFGNKLGLFSVSGFYRVIDDMFHTVSNIPGVYKSSGSGSLLDTLGIAWHPSIPNNSPVSLTYSVNSTQPTKVWGIEVEHQANLTWLPGLLSNIVLSYNFSLVRSETFVLSYRIDTTFVIIPGFPPLPQFSTTLIESRQKLEGQPDFFGNVALGYDLGGFSGRVSVFFQGAYNRSYSAGRLNDPVVQDFSRWDLSIRQKLTENISVFLNLNNFTSVVEDVHTIDRVNNWEALRSSQRYGLTGDVGVRVDL